MTHSDPFEPRGPVKGHGHGDHDKPTQAEPGGQDLVEQMEDQRSTRGPASAEPKRQYRLLDPDRMR